MCTNIYMLIVLHLIAFDRLTQQFLYCKVSVMHICAGSLTVANNLTVLLTQLHL